ncbi:MAG: FAD:protein FMN transferase, partial [Oscillospiraceae bacterium]
ATSSIMPITEPIEVRTYGDSTTIYPMPFLTNENMSIDLGGVAKGYLCDEIKKIYKNNDVKWGIVSLGGNICAYGDRDFTIGIRDPKGLQNDIIGKLVINSKIVATTGAYERYFEENGQVYHHILDVKTGYPVKSKWQSVTIISENGALADFLSTYLFSIDKIDFSNPEYSVIAIDNENTIHISANLDFETVKENRVIKYE